MEHRISTVDHTSVLTYISINGVDNLSYPGSLVVCRECYSSNTVSYSKTRMDTFVYRKFQVELISIYHVFNVLTPFVPSVLRRDEIIKIEVLVSI